MMKGWKNNPEWRRFFEEKRRQQVERRMQLQHEATIKELEEMKMKMQVNYSTDSFVPYPHPMHAD